MGTIKLTQLNGHNKMDTIKWAQKMDAIKCTQ